MFTVPISQLDVETGGITLNSVANWSWTRVSLTGRIYLYWSALAASANKLS